jgi:predicted ATPase
VVNGRKCDGQPVSFQKINLIVGKNATGKSKTINVIRQLSDLLSGDVKLSQLMYNTSSYDLLFDDNGKEVSYVLEFEEGKVKQEVLQINGVSKLQRNSQTGTMFYEKANTDLEFQMEEDKLAVSRVDNIQHHFLSLCKTGENHLITIVLVGNLVKTRYSVIKMRLKRIKK